MKSLKNIIKFIVILSSFPILVVGQSIHYESVFNPVKGMVKDLEKPVRNEICLNGKWKIQTLYNVGSNDFNIPDQFNWEATDIKIPSPWNVNNFTDGKGGDFLAYPSYPVKWKSAVMAWMQKKVFIPSNWQGKQMILHFEGILGKAKIYVNNVPVAENFELFLPVEVDVTSYLKTGQDNEIMVGVAKAGLFDIQGKYGKRTYVGGSMWGIEMAGIWQDVYLFAYPTVNVKDQFVQPDVKNSLLKLEVEIQNNTSLKKEIIVTGAIKRWINETGSKLNELPEEKGVYDSIPALTFPSKKSVIAPHSTVKIILEQTVKDQLEYWTPDSPHLYGSEVSIFEKKSVIDKKIERFGWRQFTTDNGKLSLNGKSIVLKSDSWHFTGVPQMTRRYAWAWFTMLKDAGANAVRLHAEPFPRFYLDMADEMGICVLDETGIWSSDGGPKIDSDDYWKSCESHLRKLIQRDKNHPSVFGWSVCNENIPVALYVFKAPEELVEKQLQEINHWVAIAREMDPTRSWVSGDGETDRKTDLPILIGHYGDENALKNWSLQGKVWGVGETSMAYYGTPKQVSKVNGNRAYESMMGRMEGIAQESYNLIKLQRAFNASYTSVFNLVWYALQPLPLGLSDVTRSSTPEDGIFFDFKEGLPGMQPERLGPYTSTLNPGYDLNLPLYRPWPMFDAIKAANTDSILPYNIIKEYPEDAKFKIASADVVKVFATYNSTLKKELLEMGLTLLEKKNITDKSLMIIDGRYPPTDQKTILKIKQGISTGARIFVWGVTSASLNDLNHILPYKIELSERKATSFLKMKEVSMLQGLSNADFYFSELLTKGETAMNYGLAGDFIIHGQTWLKACNTDWQRWNYQSETTKTANVYRSELEIKGSDVVIASANFNNSQLIISTLDFKSLKQESDVIIRAILINLGAQISNDGTSNMKSVDGNGKLQTALICGAFNTGAKTTEEMLDYNFIKNENNLKPQLADQLDGKRWVLVNADKNGIIDIRNSQISGSNENAAVYISFWLFSPRSMVNLLAEPDMPHLNMLIGAEKGIALYINGSFVEKKSLAEFVEDGNRINNLPLDKGWNHILLKVVRGSGEGNWKANIRFESNSPEYMKLLLSSVAR